MARTLSSFTTLLRQRSPKVIQNPNQHLSYIGNDGRCDESHDKLQHSSEVVKQICGTIRSKPRWENTLLMDFPGVSFLDTSYLNQIVLYQNNAFLSIRLLYWLSSTFGYSPAQSTCGLIFNALIEDKAVKAAKSFLSFSKFVPELAGLELYVRCLCESTMIEDALAVFDELKMTGFSPSLETWNCVLLAAIKGKYSDLVWELHGEMIESGVVADVHTVDHLIQAFCLDKNVSKGYELLRQVLDDGYVPHKVAFDKLIYEFVLDEKYNRVSALLHIMIAKGVNPDLYTYQQIIHGLCLRRMQREALRIFNDLKDRGYAPNKIMYTTMIHGLCKIKWIGEARKLWFEMIQKGIEPDKYTYNTLLYGYFKIGDIWMALNLYKEMRGRDFKESVVAYNTMINGLCLHGRTMEAFRLFMLMVQNGIARDVITYNSLIRGFCKEGKIAEGLNLLRELVEQGLQPSSSSYGPLIESLFNTEQIVEVQNLWNEMQDRGVEPATPCIDDHVIIGLSKKGYVAAGLYWLAYMVKNRLIPRQGTFEKLIGILSQWEKSDAGLIVLGHMFKIGYRPSSRLEEISGMGTKTFEIGVQTTKFLVDWEFAKIAKYCLDSDPKERPTMSEVVVALQRSLALQEKFDDCSKPRGLTRFTWKMPRNFVPPTKDNSSHGYKKLSRNSKININHISFPADGSGCCNQVLPDNEKKLGQDLKLFSYDDLQCATGNFQNGVTKIGRHWVSKGWIHEKTHSPAKQSVRLAIIVNKLLHRTEGDLRLLGEFCHPNLHQPLGYGLKDGKLYLEHEFMVNRSLKDYLRNGAETELSFDTRVKIATGVGRGLVFLQRKQLIIKDWILRTDNIWLDKDFNAKLFYFDVAKLVNQSLKGCGRRQCDVTGLGMLMMEILTGRPMLTKIQMELVRKEHLARGKVAEMSDGMTKNLMDPQISLKSLQIERVRELITVILTCYEGCCTMEQGLKDLEQLNKSIDSRMNII